MSEVVLEQQPDGYRVRGELSFDTVAQLLGRSPVHGAQLRVDLGGVSRTDSAGLALLVSWMREARHAGCDIRFSNVPPQLLAIARVSGFDRLLPVAAP
ncbi:MAG: STAS domain-containing protein [Gammaproteobacteria bacterium]|nr:STAS domain-containing protein [Gammaproteobacteria bacterium]